MLNFVYLAYFACGYRRPFHSPALGVGRRRRRFHFWTASIVQMEWWDPNRIRRIRGNGAKSGARLTKTRTEVF